MLTNFEVVKITQLGFALVMELEELTDEVLIIPRKLLSILLQVKDSASLALDLIDISVVGTGNFVRGTCTLSGTTLAGFLGLTSQLLLLLNVSELGLNAELIVTTLLLPESLQFLAECL